jgi:hypothetical protein
MMWKWSFPKTEITVSKNNIFYFCSEYLSVYFCSELINFGYIITVAPAAMGEG